MTNSVSNRQMFFIIFLTLTSYTTIELPKSMAQTAGRSSWIMIVIAAMIYSIAAVIITQLNNMFKGKVLFDYGQEIVGKFLTFIIVLFYLLVSIMIGVYLKVKLVHLLTANFLPKTPEYALLLIGVLVFGYVAYKGITNIARMYEIIGILYLIITTILCFFMIFEGMKENVLPIFQKRDFDEFIPAMKNLVIPFTGMGFLLVVPFSDKNKKASKVAYLSVLFIGLFYILTVESTIMMLGLINTATFHDAFIEGIKMIKFPVIERTDILYLTFGLTSLFAGTITINAAAVEFACKLFSSLKRYVIVIAICVVLFVLSMISLEIINFSDVFDSVAPFVLVMTSILIPAVLLVIAKFK